MAGRKRYLLCVSEIANGVAVRILLQRVFVDVCRIALKDDLTAQTSSVRSYVDEVVGSPHDFLVVFDNDNRVAYIPKFFEHFDETVGVTGMKTDAGFVENI